MGSQDVAWAEKDWPVFASDLPLFSLEDMLKPKEVHFEPLSHASARTAGTPSSVNAPNDPQFGNSWGFDQFNDKDIDGPEAWDIHTGTGGEIIVAVIDTGVAYNHEDLRNQMWINEGEIPGNGVDSGDPMDDNGHGTHCAGVIGAQANNGLGVAG